MIGRARPRLDAPGAAFLACLAAFGTAAAPYALAAPGVDFIQVRPNPFTPNGDGQRDFTELFFTPLGDSATVDVRVVVFRVAGEVPMGEILPTTPLPKSVEHRVAWNPGPIQDGLYRFDIQVTQGAANAFGSAYVDADTTAPSVSIGAVAPNPFDSSVPGAELHVPFTVVTNDSTTATTIVIRHDGATVDSLGVVEGGGTFALDWDGRSATDTPFASDAYEVFADTRDLAGNVGTASRAFTVDRDVPKIVLPSLFQTTSFPFALRGEANDDDRVVRVLSRVLPESTFVLADSMSAVADTVDFVVLVQDAAPVPGRRDVEIRAEDELGHAAVVSVEIAYDTFLPVPVSTVPVDGPGPYGEEETVRVRTLWNADDLEIEGDFSNLDSRWVPGAETVVNEGGGSYLLSYTLSRSAGVGAGTKRIDVIGRKGFLAGTDSTFVSFQGGTTSPEITVDRNRFDPSRGERARILAPEIGQAIEVEIYNLAGARVRTLSGSGEVAWDGKTEEGAIAASGTYFLRCTSGSVEDVRRVVVRKEG